MNNILVIPDIHSPFTDQRALQHCKATYKKYKCNKVIFIGDIIDNAATTHFGANPDGMSPIDELNAAIKQLKPWYKAFPNAIVTIGNHEERLFKSFKKVAIADKWLKSFSEVLGVPGWEFVNEITIDNVTYFHGEGCSSTIQALYQSKNSIVFGHFHSRFELIYNQDKFGMCTGWLGDQEAYAFDYSRTTLKKGILGCGVVLNNGTLPILIKLN